MCYSIEFRAYNKGWGNDFWKHESRTLLAWSLHYLVMAAAEGQNGAQAFHLSFIPSYSFLLPSLPPLPPFLCPHHWLGQANIAHSFCPS